MSGPARLTAALADRYTIERELGQGGMATVYLAHDIKHDRKVAIKVLRPELSAVIGAERFLREIKTIATLQHPHILGLIDSGEVSGTAYYVMPFVEGESLRDRLNREKQLPIGDAVRLATEVAGALDYAHRHGVIHRDIKPENIMLHDGSALVADFGIALAASTAGTRMTETGMSLGTPHYMSPEQAMGEREITARSDVYALGCVTYEMLTGDPPFTGSTAQAIVAKVMTEKPVPPSRLRDTVPNGVEDAVLTALAKLPADRFGTVAEFAAALTSDGASPQFRRSGSRQSARGHDRRVIAALVAALLVAVLAAGWGWLRSGSGRLAPLAYQIHLTRSEVDLGFVAMQVAVGPRGETIVFSDTVGGTRQLWVKDRGVVDPRPIPGTIGGQAPFLSPDGASVAFAVGTRLMRIPIAGGSAQQISDSASTVEQWPGAWLDDGTIIFLGAAGDLIFAVDAAGGPTTRLFSTDDIQNSFPVRFSQVPGRRQVIISSCEFLSCTNPRVTMLDVDSGKLESFLPGAVGAWAVPGGRLLYLLADRSMFLAPFDAETHEVGVGIPLFGNVMISGRGPEVAISPDGVILHGVGEGAAASNIGEFIVVDPSGTVTRVDSSWNGAFLNNTTIDLSSDGSNAVFSLLSESRPGGDVYLKPFPIGAPIQFTFDGTLNARPVWSPDGSRIAWISDRSGRTGIWMRNADGSGVPEWIEVDERNVFEVRFTADGEWLLYRTDDVAAGRGDIYAKRLRGDTATIVVAATEAEETSPIVSPDGKWIAFAVRFGAVKEVVVRPFPDVEKGRTQVSVGGGVEPLWSADGSRLYYRQLTAGKVIAADVSTTGGFRVTGRTVVLETPQNSLMDNDDSRQYTLMPNGKDLLMIRRLSVDTAAPVLSGLVLREHALPNPGKSP
ncbi:MAG: serine/threonine-protein kinase [Gemmatimonadales bacterium]|nr:serine/threonine-protein kinase [Gemmatimonadales bacterium]